MPARLRLSVFAATAAATMLAIAPAASAHDSVIDANPGIDETVSDFPAELKLEFSGNPKPDFNTLALSRTADNEVLFSGTPDVDGRFVSIDVPEGLEEQPGEYRIGFQITSSDGHATKGMTTFTYDPQGTLAAQGASDAEANQDGAADVGSEEVSENSDEVTGGGYTWLWLLMGTLLLGGVGIAAMGKRQQNQQADKRIRDLDYNETKEGNQYNRSGHTGAGYTAGDDEQGAGTARRETGGKDGVDPRNV